MTTWQNSDCSMKLALGRYQDVYSDQLVDAVVADPPYSDKTHDGYNTVVDGAADNTWHAKQGIKNARANVRAIDYAAWSEADVRECVRFWSVRCLGWMVFLTDRFLAPFYESEMQACDRLPFVLPLYQPGSRCRLSGDGPSNWTCWIVAARPRTQEFQRWGTLPGGYSGPVEDMPIVGGKPLWAMRAIVRDYTRPGNVVADCCCGGATTVLAAAMEGRLGTASEIDPKTFAVARKRLERGFVHDMFSGAMASAATEEVRVSASEVDAAYRRGVADGRKQIASQFRDIMEAAAAVEEAA